MNSDQKQTYCLGDRRYSNTINQKVYEKITPKIRRLVKFIKGKCDTCDRKKGQIFTK